MHCCLLSINLLNICGLFRAGWGDKVLRGVGLRGIGKGYDTLVVKWIRIQGRRSKNALTDSQGVVSSFQVPGRGRTENSQ